MEPNFKVGPTMLDMYLSFGNHVLCFAIQKTIPLNDPTAMASTPDIVTGVSKNMSPLSATGILLSAPTIEYVAALVTRTHQAEVWEMAAAPKPVQAMAISMCVRDPTGKLWEMFA